MNILAKIRRGEGAGWGRLKSIAKILLRTHIPAGGVLKPAFGVLYSAHVVARESLIWIGRFVWFEPLFRSQCEVVGRRFRMEFLPYIVGNGRILVGNDVELSGKPSFCFGNVAELVPRLTIGDGTFIGHNASITVGGSVEIGKRCLIAGGVVIRDFDGHPLDAAERRASRRVRIDEVRPVRIGDDVWIGSAATVLKGVRIGDRSVVATGAVVTKDVPQDVVVAGNPARIVKRLASTQTAVA